MCLWVMFFLFSQRPDVEAAQCHKSNFHRWRCAPCGRGTRCIFCHWCLCYCHHHRRSKRSITNVTKPPYGEEEVQYKLPLIELFQELKTLIQNDEISNIEVVELYKSTSLALSEDCILCNDTREIEELRNQTKSIHEKLTQIMLSENITSPGSTRKKRSPSFISLESEQKFKEVALEDTSEAIKTAEKIPETVIGKIDLNSTIIESLGKNRCITTDPNDQNAYNIFSSDWELRKSFCQCVCL